MFVFVLSFRRNCHKKWGEAGWEDGRGQKAECQHKTYDRQGREKLDDNRIVPLGFRVSHFSIKIGNNEQPFLPHHSLHFP